jgi:tetratricopeptide (TPR) repeat protein
VENGAVSGASRAELFARRARLRLELPDQTLESLGEATSDLELANGVSTGMYDAEYAELLERQRTLSGEAGDETTERQATMRLAGLLPRLGEQRRGLELLVGWVKRKPDDADAVRGLGEFAGAAEKWGAAAKAYQRLFEITQGDDQLDAVIRLAEAAERAGAPMDARPALEHVHARAPENEAIRSRLRRMYEAAGAFEQLAAIMMQEAEHATDEQTRFERLAEAADMSRRVQGGEKTAIAAYRRAMSIRPDDAHILVRPTDTLALVGEIEEAANLLDAAINVRAKKRTPELSELQHAMARVGRVAEDYEAVFAWLEAAIQSDRQNGAAASELAVLAMEQGELDVAIRALQAITLLKESAPMSRAEAYLRQGIIAEQKGDRKKAVFLAKRALTTEPDYDDAKSFLQKIGEA